MKFLTFFGVSLALEQTILPNGLSGFELARSVHRESNIDHLSDSTFSLLREAWNSAWIKDPKKVLKALNPQSAISRPPPLKTSRKDGFSVFSLPNFPNYELRVKDPGKELGVDTVQQYSGYIDVLDQDKHFFFWLFESRNKPKEDPVMLWLSGGPGCSSSAGLFFELGPSFVTTNTSLRYNPNSWNEAATVIFLDQPVNVGYSYSSKKVDNSVTAGEDVYSFLEILFDALPQYANLPFHISGESYAGKYLPAVGKAILNHPERTFNLTSMLLGNPIVDAAIQSFSTVAMGCGEGGYPSIYKDETCDFLYRLVPGCEILLNACYDSNHNLLVCEGASMFCSTLTESFFDTGHNPYDLSLDCGMECYPELYNIQEYMSRPEVIKAVGSDVDEFNLCSSDVSKAFALSDDYLRSETPDVVEILDAGIDVLFYDGELDFVCSWPGVYRLVERMRYKEHAEFNAASPQVWHVDGKPAGETKSAGHLHWMKVYGSGHMVPHDKGKEALAMVKQWTSQRKFTDS